MVDTSKGVLGIRVMIELGRGEWEGEWRWRGAGRGDWGEGLFWSAEGVEKIAKKMGEQ